MLFYAKSSTRICTTKHQNCTTQARNLHNIGFEVAHIVAQPVVQYCTCNCAPQRPGKGIAENSVVQLLCKNTKKPRQSAF